MCLQAAGLEADASAQFHQILEFDEMVWPVYCWLCVNYALRGMLQDAVAYADKAYALAPWHTEAIGALAGLLVRTGDTRHADELLQKLRTGQAYAAPIGFLIFHLLCGDIEAAANWAEKAIEQRHLLILFYLCAPLAKPLRTSRRWPALASMVNLPETIA